MCSVFGVPLHSGGRPGGEGLPCLMSESFDSVTRDFEQSLMLPQHQARARRKTDKLIQAGLRLIAARGYDGIRIADLAREADCLPATFYQRFRDKEAFLAVLHLRVIRGIKDGLERERVFEALAKLEPEAAVHEVARRTVAIYGTSRPFIREVVHHASADPEFMLPRAAFGDYLRRRIAEAFRPHFKRFSHPDPALAIGLALDAWFGLLDNIVTYETGPVRTDDPRLPDELARMMLGYLGFRRKS